MVAPIILAAIGISSEAWKALPADQKKKIKAQITKGALGMAKIMTKRAKKTLKAKKKTKKGKK